MRRASRPHRQRNVAADQVGIDDTHEQPKAHDADGRREKLHSLHPVVRMKD